MAKSLKYARIAGQAELVRAGAAQGEVVAEFDLPAGHAARAVLAEAGLTTPKI